MGLVLLVVLSWECYVFVVYKCCVCVRKYVGFVAYVFVGCFDNYVSEIFIKSCSL